MSEDHAIVFVLERVLREQTVGLVVVDDEDLGGGGIGVAHGVPANDTSAYYYGREHRAIGTPGPCPVEAISPTRGLSARPGPPGRNRRETAVSGVPGMP